jgi:hypothetical protein
MVSGVLDLGGTKRVWGSRPDMGAYEAPPPTGSMFMIR